MLDVLTRGGIEALVVELGITKLSVDLHRLTNGAHREHDVIDFRLNEQGRWEAVLQGPPPSFATLSEAIEATRNLWSEPR